MHYVLSRTHPCKRDTFATGLCTCDRPSSDPELIAVESTFEYKLLPPAELPFMQAIIEGQRGGRTRLASPNVVERQICFLDTEIVHARLQRSTSRRRLLCAIVLLRTS